MTSLRDSWRPDKFRDVKKRPITVAVIGWVFIGIGAVGLVRGLWPLMGLAAPGSGVKAESEPLRDALYVLASGLVAGVGGAFAIRGRNWARWLLVAWMGFHIVLSLLHSATKLIVHCALFGVILWYLFRPRASEYFRGTDGHSSHMN